ncbi:helix-turn-helix domain-containing protein [Agathobaculum sp.]|uniref:helix-turn-helix domain-containing protein n=1 Tax=Agathobaculum sp. TaxID=2048138 RepID=UPI002A809308|nr:XRE family transcriptional regulator [Agathobaculum sp.]MDY3618368.1 XRE family transcriptional regulator [Agathobaculum sp.]
MQHECKNLPSMDNNRRKTISEKLHELKAQAGLTTAQVSGQTGVPRSTLNKLLCGATHRPALQTMEKLARFFNVPVRYLLDDHMLPEPEHEIGAFDAHCRFITLSERETALVEGFRRLNERDKEVTERLVAVCETIDKSEPYSGKVVALPCHYLVPRETTRQTFDSFVTRRIAVRADELAAQADFAVVMTGNALNPAYARGDILGVSHRKVKHGEIGAFLLNGQAYIRQLYIQRGRTRLDTINRAVPNIPVLPEDEFVSLGAVIGKLHPARV